MARRAIGRGEKVRKWGVSSARPPADRARRACGHAQPPEHYLPTFNTREQVAFAKHDERAISRGYPRTDGRKGIATSRRSPTSSSARTTWRARSSTLRDRATPPIGFAGCYPNAYADRMMRRLCTHPNVGAVLLVSLGCESFDRAGWRSTVRAPAARWRRSSSRSPAARAGPSRRGRPWVERVAAASSTCSRRADARWTSWSWARSAAAPTPPAASRPTRRSAAPSTCWSSGAPLHLRGDRRTDRLRAPHGGPRRHARARPASSSRCVEKAAATTRTSATAASRPATPRAASPP